MHHFADDTNLLDINKSHQELNTFINTDFENLINWLNASKISLNVSKIDLDYLKPKKSHMDFDLKIKLNVKRLYPTDSLKYFGVRIDCKHNWKADIVDIAIKLIRVI